MKILDQTEKTNIDFGKALLTGKSISTYLYSRLIVVKKAEDNKKCYSCQQKALFKITEQRYPFESWFWCGTCGDGGG